MKAYFTPFFSKKATKKIKDEKPKVSKSEAKTEAPKPKSVLFDSDSDDDLFKPKTTTKLGNYFISSVEFVKVNF